MANAKIHNSQEVRTSMTESVANSYEAAPIESSHGGGTRFAQVFRSLSSIPELEECEHTWGDIEVDEHFNQLASRLNLRKYFERAGNELDLQLFGDVPDSLAAGYGGQFLDYVVPGLSKPEGDQARELYLYSSQVVEAQQWLQLVFSILSEEQRKTIQEKLRNV